MDKAKMMNTNPVNLTVRFLLELAILYILGWWGWHAYTGWVQYVTAIGLPAVAATLWGVFRIENDPKAAPVAIPGMLRLLLEWILFGGAVAALYDMGYVHAAVALAVITILHYIVSYDRTWAMLRNKPYNGFVK